MVARAASRRGLRVLIEETEGSLEGERALLTGAEAGLVDGLLFQPSRMGSAEIAQYRAGVPLVQLGEMPAPLTIDRVQIDNIAAARAVTAHLVASGRRRIGFVGHERSGQSETSRQRLAGYQLALEEAGIRPDPGLLIASDEISAVGAMSAVSRAFENDLDVDALVCRDDLAAMGTLRAVQERGLRVPDDIAITGWDDIRLSAVTFPGLTTIAADTEAMVERALGMLLERIEGYDGMGRHEQVPYSLIVRGSAPAAD
jgi:DNA-binding LacI/PurR family transcriptional regulator